VLDLFARKIAVAHARITPLSCNDLALVATDTPPILLSTHITYIECKHPSNGVVFVRKQDMAHALRQTTMEQYEAWPMVIHDDIEEVEYATVSLSLCSFFKTSIAESVWREIRPT
jgi:hypothetical protein